MLLRLPCGILNKEYQLTSRGMFFKKYFLFGITTFLQNTILETQRVVISFPLFYLAISCNKEKLASYHIGPKLTQLFKNFHLVVTVWNSSQVNRKVLKPPDGCWEALECGNPSKFPNDAYMHKNATAGPPCLYWKEFYEFKYFRHNNHTCTRDF